MLSVYSSQWRTPEFSYLFAKATYGDLMKKVFSRDKQNSDPVKARMKQHIVNRLNWYRSSNGQKYRLRKEFVLSSDEIFRQAAAIALKKSRSRCGDFDLDRRF